MSRRVIIVESPNKAKTLRALVGRDYDVVATVGHFCDLPAKEMGVDVTNGFKPTYVYDEDKKDVVAKLRALRERRPADILVASDADREGEAIGWHIARTIGIDPRQVVRVEFHEITAPGVQRALAAPRALDLGLVAAQEARRILDRLVGYTVSPVVRDRLPDEKDISAGRVQSVALRVVVDRELAIRAFVAKAYWTVHASYPWPGDARRRWEAVVLGRGPVNKPVPIAMDDAATATTVAAALAGAHRVARVARKQAKRHPPAPFITSTMLQKASTRLKMSTDETTRHAKTLFERGLVTYIRTDTPAVSPEFQAETLAYLRAKHGAAIVPAKPNQHKAKGAANAQGAHECIRPTALATEQPDGLDARAVALYQLIRETYLASQCNPALYDVTEIRLTCRDLVLEARGRVLVAPGFLAVFPQQAEEEEAEPPLPAIAEGETHTPREVAPREHWTKPPERFTEASLIKYLEEKGIGRPSTFNSMVAKIRTRAFVTTVNKRFLAPTPKGEKLDAELRTCFGPVIKEGFTAEIETHLDAIAAREEAWRDFLQRFWDDFTPLVDAARQGTVPRARRGAGPRSGGEVPDPNAPPCPKCHEGFTRRIRSTKTGKDYFICGRDSREHKVCGYIAAVEDEAEMAANPPCYRCGLPMKHVASRNAYRCRTDACDSWLDDDFPRNAPCPNCQGPTRRVEGKGYGCVKWRKAGGEGSCQGWVAWADWSPPAAAPGGRKPARATEPRAPKAGPPKAGPPKPRTPKGPPKAPRRAPKRRAT